MLREAAREDGEQREKLWRYNQHYFDDLNALDGAARAQVDPLLGPAWLGLIG